MPESYWNMPSEQPTKVALRYFGFVKMSVYVISLLPSLALPPGSASILSCTTCGAYILPMTSLSFSWSPFYFMTGGVSNLITKISKNNYRAASARGTVNTSQRKNLLSPPGLYIGLKHIGVRIPKVHAN